MSGEPGTSDTTRHMIEDHFPRFKLEFLVGQGAFANVYKVLDTETNETIGLKCFVQEMKNLRRYHYAAKEVAFMKILEHPNIVQLKLFEVNVKFVFIGAEFAAFGSLYRVLAKQKPLPEKFIQVVIKQCASALDYMHTLGIIHGDLKPQNILCVGTVNHIPTVKICDFGLSDIKLVGRNFSFFSGSYLFMAPEVYLRQNVDMACDLWSLGVVMYTMMFCRSLFEVDEGQVQKTIKLLRRQVLPNFEGCERYSVTCNDLLKKLLTYEQSIRIQGEALRAHPFLELEPPKTYEPNYFLDRAQAHIVSATNLISNKKIGEGLVEGLQAQLELKIHYNLLADDSQRSALQTKLDQFQDFIYDAESKLLAVPELTPEVMEKGVSDEEFKKYLSTTPKMLQGFDIGLRAEMFHMEHKLPKALQLYHQALQILLPLLKAEPKSCRKTLLGKRLLQWIETIETLTATVDGGDSSKSRKGSSGNKTDTSTSS